MSGKGDEGTARHKPVHGTARWEAGLSFHLLRCCLFPGPPFASGACSGGQDGSHVASRGNPFLHKHRTCFE